VRILGHFVTFTEDVGVKLAEMDRCPSPLHPVSEPNVLCDKGCPDGDRLEWSAASGRLESHAFRVLILKDLELVKIPGVSDLAGSMLVQEASKITFWLTC
jgi:hypothetical protein